jgi:putative Mg2+ transporter-C (MgtC) family protein
MTFQVVLLRLTVAAVLGSLVGLERHRADKSAGMRTHMLVSLGSALIMIVSAYAFDDVISPSRVVLDPSRVAAQVVSGVGFLGAGTILRRKSEVHGLTTAAGIWVAAGIGLAAGGGLYVAASAGTALMLITLTAIKPLEERLSGHCSQHTLTLVVNRDSFALKDFEATLRAADLELKGVRYKARAQTGEQQLTFTIARGSDRKMLDLVERLQSDPTVREAGFESRNR